MPLHSRLKQLLKHLRLTAKKIALRFLMPSRLRGPDDAHAADWEKSQDLSALVREDEDGVGDLFAAWPYSW